MNRVIDQCIADGILVKLLMERRDEIMDTSIFQYDQEAHEWALHEDGYDEGYDEGIQQGIQQGETFRAEQATRIAELEKEVEKLEAKLKASGLLDENGSE